MTLGVYLYSKHSKKNQQDLHTIEADLQNLKLKGSGPFTLKNNFEQNTCKKFKCESNRIQDVT